MESREFKVLRGREEIRDLEVLPGLLVILEICYSSARY
jgi:hypothetical protein